MLILSFQIVFSISGRGTFEDPFIITNCVDLQNIRYASDKDYVLGNDINCYADTRLNGDLWNDGVGFHSIWNFTGSLIGRGGVKQISRGYMRNYSGNLNKGLFLEINEALIKDVNLEIDLNISNSGVGGLVGSGYNSIIRNCVVKGNIAGSGGNIGGVYGTLNNTWRICYGNSLPWIAWEDNWC